MCVRLVLLIDHAAFNVFPYELCKTRPPEFDSNKLESLEISGMSGSLMIMAMGKDGVAEGILQGNIDASLIHQDVVVKFPIREAGSEGSRDVLQGHL